MALRTNKPTKQLIKRVPGVAHSKYYKRLLPIIKQDNESNASYTKKGNVVTPWSVYSDYMSYFGDLSIGTPNQDFLIQIDTGSSDLWVASSACSSSACSNHVLYDSSSSSTYVNDGNSFTINYGGGSVTGIKGKDKIQFAGLTLNNQYFGQGVTVTGLIDGAYFDGLMGLAFPTLAQINNNPITGALISSSQMSPSVFALWLGDINNLEGELDIGGLNAARYVGSIRYYAVTEYTWWVCALSSVKYGRLTDKTGSAAIFDSGTSLIGGPTASINAINREIGATSVGGGIYAVPCSSVPSLPVITFMLGTGSSNDNFPLTGSQYTMNIGGTCYSGFFAIDFTNVQDQLSWILGDVFLRIYYTVYDIGMGRVGLATST